MPHNQKFIIRASDDRIRFNLIEAIKQWPRDVALEASLKRFVPRRNIPQNSRFYATCTALAKSTGYTVEEVKRLVKDEMGWHEVIDGPLGKRKRYKSSADWNKIQMAEATEILNCWCVELGVPIEPERVPEYAR